MPNRKQGAGFPLRIAKRDEMSAKQQILLRVGALLAGIMIGGVFLALMGANPFTAYGEILKGAFVGGRRNPMSSVQGTVVKWIPLMLTALGLSFAFKMKFWNIGAEGQIMMGATFASYFALFFPNWPKPVLLVVMLLAGLLGGGLWALIPALFKVRFGTNETLLTLMMNYIAQYSIVYLESGPWQRTPGFASVGSFEESAYLPSVGGVHIGWIIAVLLVVLVFVYLFKTKQGYEISVVGESQATARYAGMNVKKIIVRTMFISGAVCGLVGMIQTTGYTHTLTTGVTGGVGWTGIIVAWIAQLNPIMIALVSALFAILEKGSSVMQSSMGLSIYVADVLQGILLFVVLGSEFFIRYRLARQGKGGK